MANHFVFEVGDLEEGFKQADVIVEREFRTASVHQGYIEPHSATAHWNADGNLTVWCSSQGHFAVREMTARILGIPISRVKVIPMEIGGGFGGKTLVYLEPVVSMLSKKTGQPVKVSMSRTEVFEGTGPTSGSYMKVRIGATREGKITAADGTLIYEAGAFPGSPVNPGAQCMFGPYDLANARVEGYDIVLEQTQDRRIPGPWRPRRGLRRRDRHRRDMREDRGGPPWVPPQQWRQGRDPEDIGTQVPQDRLPGDGPGGQESRSLFRAPAGPNRGRGVATGFWFNGAGPSSATASVNPDGTISLVEGSPDIGGTRAAVAMQLAEVLGISAEDVKPSVGDTDSVGFTSTTGGSGVAFKTGWACYEAAQDVVRQLVERAARIWECSTEDVEYKDAVLSHKSDPELRLTLKELAPRLNGTGGPVVGRANVDPRGVGGAFAVHIVDVEVDPETGKVDILRYTALQDAGKAVHPSYVEGQIQGGVSQGIGWALNEEYFFNNKGRWPTPASLITACPPAWTCP